MPSVAGAAAERAERLLVPLVPVYPALDASCFVRLRVIPAVSARDIRVAAPSKFNL